MVAVDTNLLVCAHRANAPSHRVARKVVEALAQGAAAWAIPWPCAHEFVAVVTNVRIFKTPTPTVTALKHLRTLAALPHVAFLAEGEGYVDRLEEVALPAQVSGQDDEPTLGDERSPSVRVATEIVAANR